MEARNLLKKQPILELPAVENSLEVILEFDRRENENPSKNPPFQAFYLQGAEVILGQEYHLLYR
jgi:hypothetical protein